jgi:AraC-like DNA-binding protein
MSAQQVDIIVRVAGSSLLLLLGLMLIRDARRDRIVLFFIPFALCLCGFLARNTPDEALRLTGGFAAAAKLLSGYAAVFLWWFCLALFDRRFKLGGPVLFIGSAWIAIASADRGLFGQAFVDRGLSWLLVGLGLAMVGHLSWRLVRDRESDLLEARRNARIFIAVLLAAQLLIDLCVDIAFGFGWRPRWFTIFQNAAILALAAWLILLMLRVTATPVGLGSRGTSAIVSSRSARLARPMKPDPLADRVQLLMEIEQVHLDPQLTFGAFAKRVGAPERTVRHLINRRLGYDHFRSFLNAHRVAEARRLLADPGRSEEKLMSIALDSGFASLASFNRVFKECAGCAPSEFRATALRLADNQAADQGAPEQLGSRF